MHKKIRKARVFAHFVCKVDEKTVKYNFDRVLAVVQETARKQVARFEGQDTEVLVEEINTQDEEYVTGRMSNNTLVHFKGDSSLIGKIVKVHLDESKGFYYLGTLIC